MARSRSLSELMGASRSSAHTIMTGRTPQADTSPARRSTLGGLAQTAATDYLLDKASPYIKEAGASIKSLFSPAPATPPVTSTLAPISDPGPAAAFDAATSAPISLNPTGPAAEIGTLAPGAGSGPAAGFEAATSASLTAPVSAAAPVAAEVAAPVVAEVAGAALTSGAGAAFSGGAGATALAAPAAGGGAASALLCHATAEYYPWGSDEWIRARQWLMFDWEGPAARVFQSWYRENSRWLAAKIHAHRSLKWALAPFFRWALRRGQSDG